MPPIADIAILSEALDGGQSNNVFYWDEAVIRAEKR